MKNILIYCIEWDNPNRDLNFGESLPRVMYFTLNQDQENLTKEELCKRISKSWFGWHKPVALHFREATPKELDENCHKNFWPIIRELKSESLRTGSSGRKLPA